MQTQETSIPVVNQLRYVATHLLRWHEQGCADSDELGKAYSHCLRAKYDALEISALFLLARIRGISETVAGCSYILKELIGDYSDLKSGMLQAKRFFEEDSPETDIPRASRIPTAETMLEKLRAYVTAYNENKEEIEDRIEQIRKQDRRYVRNLAWSIVGALAAIAGVIVSVICAVD